MPKTSENTVKRHEDNSVRKAIRKAPGTRLGTIQDWRSAGSPGKAVSRHGSSIRDGR